LDDIGEQGISVHVLYFEEVASALVLLLLLHTSCSLRFRLSNNRLEWLGLQESTAARLTLLIVHYYNNLI
jgi:hypothetical protein